MDTTLLSHLFRSRIFRVDKNSSAAGWLRERTDGRTDESEDEIIWMITFYSFEQAREEKIQRVCVVDLKQ